MSHICHAVGCGTQVPPKLLMCPRHWALVPIELQRGVWAAYVPGQEIRKDPTEEYLDVQSAAVNAVMKYERSVKQRDKQIPGKTKPEDLRDRRRFMSLPLDVRMRNTCPGCGCRLIGDDYGRAIEFVQGEPRLGQCQKCGWVGTK